MFQTFAVIAGLIHIYIFFLESWFWGNPKTNRIFGVSPETAEANRIFAFNQGFYNLFLAIAVLSGLGLSLVGYDTVGDTLTIYGCLSILGAGVVLYAKQKRLWRAALLQGAPPALALVFWAAERL